MNNKLQIMVWVVVQLALGWIPLQAQETRISDTLYANDQNQVALFFSLPDTTGDNWKFTGDLYL